MATGAELDEYDRLEKKHKKKVREAKQKLGQALPRAAAQLAVTIASEGFTDGPPKNLSDREGFNPDSPADSLNKKELQRLPEAMLVIDALHEYIDLTLRLANKKGPRVSGGWVSPGHV